MSIEFALEYIPGRMRDLGYGEGEYYITPEHLVLAPKEVRQIDASSSLYILVEEADDVSVVSTFGIFDLTLTSVNKLDYEHQGQITITNYLSSIKHIRFIQAIPKHKQTNTK